MRNEVHRFNTEFLKVVWSLFFKHQPNFTCFFLKSAFVSSKGATLCFAPLVCTIWLMISTWSMLNFPCIPILCCLYSVQGFLSKQHGQDCKCAIVCVKSLPKSWKGTIWKRTKVHMQVGVTWQQILQYLSLLCPLLCVLITCVMGSQNRASPRHGFVIGDTGGFKWV